MVLVGKFLIEFLADLPLILRFVTKFMWWWYVTYEKREERVAAAKTFDEATSIAIKTKDATGMALVLSGAPTLYPGVHDSPKPTDGKAT